MADYSRDEEEMAHGIVSRLLQERSTLSTAQPPRGVSITDLEDDVEEFNADVRMLHGFGQIPTINVPGGPPIPISLSSILGISRNWRNTYYLHQDLLDSIVPNMNRRFPTASLVDISEAFQNFKKRAVSFLAHRIASSRPESPEEILSTKKKKPILNLPPRRWQMAAPTPGCNFSVTTNNRGLRVFWSGAYFISGNYFAHPTTPARSVLQAGTYIFGVDGGAYGNTVRWDTKAICTLPGSASLHLNY